MPLMGAPVVEPYEAHAGNSRTGEIPDAGMPSLGHHTRSSPADRGRRTESLGAGLSERALPTGALDHRDRLLGVPRCPRGRGIGGAGRPGSSALGRSMCGDARTHFYARFDQALSRVPQKLCGEVHAFPEPSTRSGLGCMHEENARAFVPCACRLFKGAGCRPRRCL